MQGNAPRAVRCRPHVAAERLFPESGTVPRLGTLRSQGLGKLVSSRETMEIPIGEGDPRVGPEKVSWEEKRSRNWG